MALTTVPRTCKRALNLAERIAVIEEFEKNQNKSRLAREFNCGIGQITNILRHKEEYLAEYDKHKDPTRMRRGRSTELAFLGMIVCEWVKRCRSVGVAITDDLIKNIGTKVASLINYKDFRSTNRWLGRFKGKYKLEDVDLLKPCRDQVVKADLPGNSLDLEKIIEELKDYNVKLYEKGAVPTTPPIKKSNGIRQYGRKKEPRTPFDSDDSSSANLSALNVLQISMNGFGSDETSSSNNLDEDLESEIQVKMENVYQDIEEEGNIECAKQIQSYKEALNHLGPLEQFVLLREDVRAIGLINQLENMFRDNMARMNQLAA